MNQDVSCSICSAPTLGLSSIRKITQNSKLNWVSDSTIKLLGWNKVHTQYRFCPTCFHGFLFPKYDTARLYGSRGVKVRKQVYASYFPKSLKKPQIRSFNFAIAFSNLSRDLFRFYQTALLISEHFNTTLHGFKQIKILDWGGGDGYVSSTYSNILETITGVPVKNYVFDYTKWEDIKSEKIGLDNLNKNDKFHIILFSHVLEHTHDPVSAIKFTLPFLANQGLVICEVPDERYHLINALKKKTFGLDFHVTYFSRRSLSKTLTNSGLNNIQTTYQENSSYRGTRINSILAVAQKTKQNHGHKPIPSSLQETFSLVIYFIKNIIIKN